MTAVTSITVRVPLTIRHRPGRKTVVTPMTDGVAPVTIRVEIVRKSKDQVGFAVHARRSVVERFFAWIGRTEVSPRTSRPPSPPPTASSRPPPLSSYCVAPHVPLEI